MSIAIIGAGMAGLILANTLHQAGYAVTLYEKSRGFGGRMATRRTEDGNFDHGAPFFTVRDAEFIHAVANWKEQGLVRAWNGRLRWIGRRGDQQAHQATRYTGVPSMSRIGRALSTGLTQRSGVRVTALQAMGDRWRLTLDNNETAHHESVILAVPAPQAHALLQGQHYFAECLTRVEIAPCWTLMARADENTRNRDLGFDAAFVADGSALGWLSREDSKPERPSSGNWLIHSHAEWAASHLAHAHEWIQHTLLTEAQKHLGGTLTPVALHRWLYARTLKPLGTAYLYDASLRLGVVGDWCLGDRVEHAFLSGHALAQHLLQTR